MYAKEKYQKIMLFLTRAGVTFWEQFRCLHIGVFAILDIAGYPREVIPHWIIPLVFFTMFQLVLTNETAGMVTGTTQLSYIF